jgi:3D (Asp-Asp-Asp) domain-containing protein
LRKWLVALVTAATLAATLSVSGVSLAASGTPVQDTCGTYIASGTRSGRVLGLTATAYAPTAADNYPYGAVDFFGRPLRPGDVAVDPRVIPLGTCLWVTGYHDPLLPAGGFYALADDTGGAIKGARVDIFINASESTVDAFGIQSVRVSILGK